MGKEVKEVVITGMRIGLLIGAILGIFSIVGMFVVLRVPNPTPTPTPISTPMPSPTLSLTPTLSPTPVSTLKPSPTITIANGIKDLGTLMGLWSLGRVLGGEENPLVGIIEEGIVESATEIGLTIHLEDLQGVSGYDETNEYLEQVAGDISRIVGSKEGDMFRLKCYSTIVELSLAGLNLRVAELEEEDQMKTLGELSVEDQLEYLAYILMAHFNMMAANDAVKRIGIEEPIVLDGQAVVHTIMELADGDEIITVERIDKIAEDIRDWEEQATTAAEGLLLANP